jgi:hypothetical protein
MPPRFAALDLGLLRALGGCLLAIGATALVLVHGPIRRGDLWALLALVILVGVSEGINAYQMSRFGSPFYGPLTFVGLMLVGVGLVSEPIGQPLSAFDARSWNCSPPLTAERSANENTRLPGFGVAGCSASSNQSGVSR